MSGLGFSAGAHVHAPAVGMRILWVRVHSAACAESAWCKLSQVDPSLQCLPAWLQAEASGGVYALLLHWVFWFGLTPRIWLAVVLLCPHLCDLVRLELGSLRTAG
jgi:hypothetical protein